MCVLPMRCRLTEVQTVAGLWPLEQAGGSCACIRPQCNSAGPSQLLGLPPDTLLVLLKRGRAAQVEPVE